MENKEVKISFWASHLTTIISVTLVLILLGMIAYIWVGSEIETRRLREQVELSAVMADSVSNAQANSIGKEIAGRPYSKDVRVVSKEQALANWTKQTGENLMELYGINPLSPEVAFRIKADYNTVEGVDSIRRSIAKIPGVETVDAPDTAMIANMNSNIKGFTMILGLVAIVMLVISFVLINNTVQLTIYSRRFTIHTMQLVGATKGFISRPVIMNNALCGLIAGFLAGVILVGALLFMPRTGIGDPVSSIGWDNVLIISGGVILTGILLTSLAACIATSRYLRKDYDDLFK